MRPKHLLLVLSIAILGGTASAGTATFVMLSYNVEKATKFDKILKNILAAKADIIALQEIDRFVPEHGERDSTALIARALGYDFRTEVEFDEPGGGQTCQSVISRFPITSSVTHRLPPIFPWEKVRKRKGGRMAQEAVIALPDAPPLHIFSVHLEALDVVGKRAQQLAYLLNIAKNRPLAVISGDLNTKFSWQAKAFSKDFLRAGYSDVFGGRLVPTTIYAPFVYKLDWMTHSTKTLSLAGKPEVLRSMKGSDHFPIRTTFTYETEEDSDENM